MRRKRTLQVIANFYNCNRVYACCNAKSKNIYIPLFVLPRYKLKICYCLMTSCLSIYSPSYSFITWFQLFSGAIGRQTVVLQRMFLTEHFWFVIGKSFRSVSSFHIKSCFWKLFIWKQEYYVNAFLHSLIRLFRKLLTREICSYSVIMQIQKLQVYRLRLNYFSPSLSCTAV